MTRRDILHHRALKVLLTGRLARYPRGARGLRLRRELERFARRHRAWLSARELEGFSFGEKTVKGRATAEPSLIIYVRRKIRQRARIKRPVPKRIRIPGLGTFITDVVAVGKFRNHSPFMNTVRPIQPGLCLSLSGGAIGTLGCLVKRVGTTAPLILSCAHVLTNNFQSAVGQGVEQSGTGHQTGPGPFRVGVTTEMVPVRFTPNINDFSNQVDAGLAALEPATRPVNPLMRLTGARPLSVGLIAQGAAVRKVGCMTDETRGTVVRPVIAKAFFYPDPRHPGREIRAGFMGLVQADYAAEEGDSGALVTGADGRILGLHMGSWDNLSLFCRFSVIASRLRIAPY